MLQWFLQRPRREEAEEEDGEGSCSREETKERESKVQGGGPRASQGRRRERKEDGRLLTAAGHVAVALEAARAVALVRARDVHALGVLAAGGGQPALVHVRALLEGLPRKAGGAAALVRARRVDARGRLAAREAPVRRRLADGVLQRLRQQALEQVVDEGDVEGDAGGRLGAVVVALGARVDALVHVFQG